MCKVAVDSPSLECFVFTTNMCIQPYTENLGPYHVKMAVMSLGDEVVESIVLSFTAGGTECLQRWVGVGWKQTRYNTCFSAIDVEYYTLETEICCVSLSCKCKSDVKTCFSR